MKGQDWIWSSIALGILLTVFGCSPARVVSQGESESGYTYIPVDPIPVQIIGDGCPPHYKPDRKLLLASLPDNAVRMLTERLDGKGTVAYGPSKAEGRGARYRVTIDYIYSDTKNHRIYLQKTMLREYTMPNGSVETNRVIVPIDSDLGNVYVAGSEEFTIGYPPDSPSGPRDEISKKTFEEESKKFYLEYNEYNIPIYIGLGLRVSADIESIEGTANITGLGVIGVEAEANKLKGSLVIQTLGVNGKSVAAALPIQSELNRTTAQNAIVAIGTIKALLHSKETWIRPRIVGLYLPFKGGQPLVNALIRELSRKQLTWFYRCENDSPNPDGGLSDDE